MFDLMGYTLHRNRMNESVDPYEFIQSRSDYDYRMDNPLNQFDDVKFPMPALVKVNVKLLNIRNEANIQSFVTEIVPKDEFLFCNLYTIDDEGRTWYHIIRNNNDHVGWVSAKYCYPESLEGTIFNDTDEMAADLIQYIHGREDFNRRKHGYGKI